MKTFNITILCLFLALIFTSCGSYISDVPISNSKNSTIDSTFIGNWKLISEDKEIVTLGVTTNRKNKYIISSAAIKPKCDKQKIRVEHLVFSAYNTVINNTKYYNISILNDKGDKFIFGKFKFKNDTLLLYLLNDDFKTTFSKSNKFKKHIINNKDQFDKNFKLSGKFVKSKRWLKLEKH